MLQTACDVAAVSKYALKVKSMGRDRLSFRHFAESTVGEIFFLGSPSERVYLLQPDGARLHAWEIRNHSIPSALAEFLALAESAAKSTLDGRRLRGMSFEWRQTTERDPGFSAYRGIAVRPRPAGTPVLTTRPAEYTTEELAAARLLIAPEVRNFLLELARLGKARSIDSGLKPEATAILLSGNIIRREFLMLCKQDFHTICKISDRSEAEGKTGSNFTCTVCGRLFKDELLQEIFGLTELGKGLLTSSRWMAIWVTHLLTEAGIPKDLILWNATAGEDELDVM
jgi:hypothetical protein